jgi:hypothetical protein
MSIWTLYEFYFNKCKTKLKSGENYYYVSSYFKLIINSSMTGNLPVKKKLKYAL